MTEKINTIAFAGSAAIVAALSMLILGVLGYMGLYTGAVEMMMKWHMFFNLSPLGIFTGMLEAFVITFAFFAIFGGLYNKLNR